jgi:hypothetical protein
MKRLLRNLNPEQISFRAFEEEGKRYLEGYASIFEQRSKPIFENNKLFTEVVKRQAFDDILKSENLNVILTFNHDRGKVMARTKSGTLQLSTDERGLRFKAEVPNTTLGNDVYELVKRGDLFENSFGFIVKPGDEQWTRDLSGETTHVINKISRLYDVSVVVDGAYANTEIIARNETERLEPTPGDNEEEFISSCVSYVMDGGETDDPEQAYAICKSKWDERAKPEDEPEMAIDDEKEIEEQERMQRHIKILKLKS